MGLFNSSCCPSKPKRTMDYILNWIDTNSLIIAKNTSFINDLIEWRRSIENDLDDHVKNIADEYITNYEWSQVPEFGAKADKVENAVLGHLASLDANGNLVDSGKEPADFAEADHAHNYISDFGGYDSCGASVNVGEGDQGAGVISLMVKGDGLSSDSKIAKIDYWGIDNLNRALDDPDTTPTSGKDKLITSGAVYTALQEKADSIHIHDRIINTDTEIGTSRIRCITDEETGAKIKFYIEPNGQEYLDAEINKDNIANLNVVLQKNPVELLPAYTGSFIILKDTTTGEYPLGVGEDPINDFVGTYSVNDYVPVIVTLQPTSAATGNKVLAFVQWKEPQTDTIVVYVYIGSVVFTIKGERVGDSITWAPDKWTKTDNSSF